MPFDMDKADSPTAPTLTTGKQTRSMCQLDLGADLNRSLIICLFSSAMIAVISKDASERVR